MGLPASKIDICNMALDYVGQSPVGNIDSPGTPTEILVARHYDDARQNVLRKYCWNFAKTRAKCSRNATPLFDYADSYQLPNDFVRFLSTNGVNDAGLNYAVTPNIRAYLGYRVVAVSNVALSDNQVLPFLADTAGFAQVKQNGDLVLHGVMTGVAWAF